jgi:hypothetical protein
MTPLQALAKLGTRPDKIARQLEKLGCKGQPGMLYCPLARYLQPFGEAVAKQDEIIIISPDFVVSHRLKTTPSLQTFMLRFDLGKYPFLIG